MSRKRITYTAEFKAKLVLEVLEGTKTLNEIATQHELLPKNLLNWKKQFLSEFWVYIYSKTILHNIDNIRFWSRFCHVHGYIFQTFELMVQLYLFLI